MPQSLKQIIIQLGIIAHYEFYEGNIHGCKCREEAGIRKDFLEGMTLRSTECFKER
jgi:hypothetical protein